MTDESVPKDIAQPFVEAVGAVDVFSWNPVRADQTSSYPRAVNNFGDLVGARLVGRMVRSASGATETCADTRPLLLTAGSVLHFATEGSTVWGAGANFKLDEPLGNAAGSVDVRAVRGPATARLLQRAGLAVPTVYGDPVLLLPQFFPELATWSRVTGDEILVVPNLNDFDSMAAEADALGIAVSNPTDSIDYVLRAVAQAQFVIGSSLHAIAVADSLGIPARFVKSPHEHLLKYRDYLAGSGRATTRIAPDLSAAIEMGPHEPLAADLDALLDVFPWDLWGGDAERTEASESAAVDNGWDDAIDAAPSENADDVSLRVMRERLTAVIAAIDDEPGTRNTGRGFDEAWSAAHASRNSSGADADTAAYDRVMRNVLFALDRDQPALARRAVWLDRVGAHALGRVRGTASGGVIVLSLRPGELRNAVERVEIVFRAPKTDPVVISPPVFEMYRRQWSIDLTLAIDFASLAGSENWSVEAILHEQAGEPRVLSVRGADSTDMSLWSFPCVAELSEMSIDCIAARQEIEREQDEER